VLLGIAPDVVNFPHGTRVFLEIGVVRGYGVNLGVLLNKVRRIVFGGVAALMCPPNIYVKARKKQFPEVLYVIFEA
jgi:hypothetical protein